MNAEGLMKAAARSDCRRMEDASAMTGEGGQTGRGRGTKTTIRRERRMKRAGR